ncbi:hypothetical protein SORDD05_01197 [Streptococcus oralis]|uniref:Uncharacterized protein n=1 Tax=Streptococcus oralis TaxID=1303 RepID=A0A139M8K2_STROR|nr:hypothetical protein [Streptococcus oralis]KXT60030.1 hypothetical protein SORDD05_01197 [Streptococcus oralis]
MKMVKALLVGIVTILLISFYAYTNLKYHSVYYAQQMPHKEGTEPDLVMLLENMWWVYTPEIEGIRYDDDGNNAIENTKTETVLSNSMGNFLYHKNRVTVAFDSTFRFFHVTDLSGEQPKKEIHEDEIKQEIREVFAPVIDAQSKPFVNLQWLFNLLYQDRFN